MEANSLHLQLANFNAHAGDKNTGLSLWSGVVAKDKNVVGAEIQYLIYRIRKPLPMRIKTMYSTASALISSVET